MRRIAVTENNTVLKLQNVETYYGKIHALRGISCTVQAGEIVTLLGANGAGKSTTLRTISGLNRAAKDRRWFYAHCQENNIRVEQLSVSEQQPTGVDLLYPPVCQDLDVATDQSVLGQPTDSIRCMGEKRVAGSNCDLWRM
jgi:ABC-type sugar transport system ATPase subunit